MGVQLKSNGPCSCAQVDKLWFKWDPNNEFNVSSACGVSQSHRKIGKSLSTLHRPAMKWFLNIWIAFLQLYTNEDVVGLTDNPQTQCSGSLGGHMMPHCPGIVVVVEVLLHTGMSGLVC